MRKKFIFCMLFAVIVNFSYGQSTATNSGGQVVTVQPKIIVVPFVKEGVDVRQLIENDDNVKIVLSKVKEAFDTRGFTTVDFISDNKRKCLIISFFLPFPFTSSNSMLFSSAFSKLPSIFLPSSISTSTSRPMFLRNWASTVKGLNIPGEETSMA